MSFWGAYSVTESKFAVEISATLIAKPPFFLHKMTDDDFHFPTEETERNDLSENINSLVENSCNKKICDE